MLSKISQFFNLLATDSTEKTQTLDIEVACAVLLFEVINADGELTIDEQEKLQSIIKHHFKFTADEVSNVIAQAKILSENANDFHRFTSQINVHYDAKEKTQIVHLLWQLAHADGKVSSIEEHIIKKIADLLYLNHSEYIQAKLGTL